MRTEAGAKASHFLPDFSQKDGAGADFSALGMRRRCIMNGIGIIAEYNPFHNGHAYQLSEAKRVSGAEYAVAVMSASFVQRGEPACADKFTRAEWALSGGADLVIELPDVLSLACAERFALGGVRLLSASGIVGGICFGSESGSTAFAEAAAAVDPSGPELRTALDSGLSYPSAMGELLRSQGIASDGTAPNDTLGAEYIRAVKRAAPDMRIYAVKRVGPGHDSDGVCGRFASASHIRRLAAAGAFADAEPCVPANVLSSMKALADAGAFPSTLSGLSDAVLFAFRRFSVQSIGSPCGNPNLSELADVSEGLENLFIKAAPAAGTCAELLSAVKTRRYTMSRLKRVCMNALLGTGEKFQRDAAFEPDALCIRVLGVRREKIGLLSALSENASLPVVISASDIKKLGPMQRAVLEHSRMASRIRALGCPADKRCADDFSHPLIIV